MDERVWDRFLTESDKAHLAKAPPKVAVGFGDRAAVLAIDNYRGAVGDRPEPLLEAIERWPSSTGLSAWTALSHIEVLFAEARAAGIEVIHATGLAAAESGMLGWRAYRNERRPLSKSLTSSDPSQYEIVEQAAPLPGEVVLKKNSPSAFFGTPLAAHLMSRGVDTLLVCGEAVSGCVRATVVDGCSYRLRIIVIEECVYDRHEATMAMNLFDIDQKYGDVVPLVSALEWIRTSASTNASEDLTGT